MRQGKKLCHWESQLAKVLCLDTPVHQRAHQQPHQLYVMMLQQQEARHMLAVPAGSGNNVLEDLCKTEQMHSTKIEPLLLVVWAISFNSLSCYVA